MLSFPLDIFPEVELLGCMVVLFLIFWGSSIHFSLVALPVYKSSLFSTSTPAFVISCLFDDGHSKRREMIFHSGVFMAGGTQIYTIPLGVKKHSQHLLRAYCKFKPSIWIIILNPYNNAGPFYRWGNWGLERLNKLLKTT